MKGFRIGHWTDEEAATGCTVVLCEEGAVPGVDVRGAAPGTRETDLLRPENTVDRLFAVVLAGGSAFGLRAAEGAVRYLEERGIGWPTPAGVVPIVAAAILYDLHVGRADRRPDAEAGYSACLEAREGPPAEGSVGAGTGATVAKLLGLERACKGGLGFAVEGTRRGLAVEAVVAVNAVGSVIDPLDGRVVAAPRLPSGEVADVMDLFREGWALPASGTAASGTTIGLVLTNARLSKQEATRVAIMAQDGVSRAVCPAHTTADGDVIFVMAWGARRLRPGELSVVGALAARAVERAIVRGVEAAVGLGGIPSAREWRSRGP